MQVNVSVGDRVRMKKPHPCGSEEWMVYRIGADIGIRCAGCDRRVLLARSEFFKRLRQIVQPASTPGENQH